jgi:hypothetical protein
VRVATDFIDAGSNHVGTTAAAVAAAAVVVVVVVVVVVGGSADTEARVGALHERGAQRTHVSPGKERNA